MKKLIDQLDELEQQLLNAQSRLIQLSLFGNSNSFTKSKFSRELRSSVNFLMQSRDSTTRKVGFRYRELYQRKLKKLQKLHNFSNTAVSTFSKLSQVFYKNQELFNF